MVRPRELAVRCASLFAVIALGACGGSTDDDEGTVPGDAAGQSDSDGADASVGDGPIGDSTGSGDAAQIEDGALEADSTIDAVASSTDASVADSSDSDDVAEGGDAATTIDACGSDAGSPMVLTTLSPVLVSGSLTNCEPGESGHMVAVDPVANTIYAAMLCENAVYVTKSVDGGRTYSTPVATGLTNIYDAGAGVYGFLPQVAILVGAAGIVYVAASTGALDLQFVRSIDCGNSWLAPTSTGGPAETVSLASFGARVYAAVIESPAGDGVGLWTNAAFGVGAFALETVSSYPDTSSEILVDSSNGDLWIADFHEDFAGEVLYHSTDGGSSFLPAINLEGDLADGRWALGGGTIYLRARVSETDGGRPTALYGIDTSAPTVLRPISGADEATAAFQYAIAADATGNAYAAVSSGGDIVIDRVPAGASAVAESTVVGTGEYPSLCAEPAGGAVAVTFTSGGSVYAAVQSY